MKKTKYIFIIYLLFYSVLAHGKVIEIKQLFNKTTVKVKEEQISINKTFYGKTTIDESRLTDIVTRFDGFITNLYANKNYMLIKKSEPLFSLYSDEILSLQKEIQISKNINKNLYRSSLEKLDRLDLSKKEINKLKRNKIKTKGVTIYSPNDVIVFKKNINNKSSVKKGKLLLQLVDINKLWFLAKVYQKDLESIRKNMEAKVYIEGINKTLKTKVDFIYPFLDEKTKTVDVRFLIDNKDLKVFPNMFAKVEIKSSTQTRLILPKTAVLNKASSYYVFKPIEDSSFEPIKVEVKRISSSKYEILDGLEANDIVLNNALFLLDSDAVTNALYDSDTDDDW